VTTLNAFESALFLAKLAKEEIRDKQDLRSYLARLRLDRAIEALEGSVDMEDFERKILGDRAKHY
jgi:hypothetical protein